MITFWIYLRNMSISSILFVISLRQWYGLKAFADDLNEYQSLEKLVYCWIIELYKEIPPLFSLFSKILGTWLFFTFFKFQCKKSKKTSVYTNKSIIFILSSKKMGVLLPFQHPLGHRACKDNKKTRIFKNLIYKDIQNT